VRIVSNIHHNGVIPLSCRSFAEGRRVVLGNFLAFISRKSFRKRHARFFPQVQMRNRYGTEATATATAATATATINATYKIADAKNEVEF